MSVFFSAAGCLAAGQDNRGTAGGQNVAAKHAAAAPTLACLMIVRDESESLARNLPLWGGGFFDAYIVAVDDRTTDDTVAVLRSVIPENVPQHVFHHTFQDFGSSR